jgi:hypothetical protein
MGLITKSWDFLRIIHIYFLPMFTTFFLLFKIFLHLLWYFDYKTVIIVNKNRIVGNPKIACIVIRNYTIPPIFLGIIFAFIHIIFSPWKWPEDHPWLWSFQVEIFFARCLHVYTIHLEIILGKSFYKLFKHTKHFTNESCDIWACRSHSQLIWKPITYVYYINLLVCSWKKYLFLIFSMDLILMEKIYTA